MLSGSSRSVSRVPGAPPRCETPPVAPSPSTMTTVQPVGRSARVKWPTLRPSTAVSPVGGVGCGGPDCRSAREEASVATTIATTPNSMRRIRGLPGTGYRVTGLQSFGSFGPFGSLAFSCSSFRTIFDPNVVDKPNVADPEGAGNHYRPVDLCDGLHRVRVDDLQVLESERGIGWACPAGAVMRRRNGFHCPAFHLGGVPLAGANCVACRGQGPEQRDRKLAFAGVEPPVARARRQAVWLPYSRDADDRERQVEVGCQPPDDRQLLRILFAEVGDVGPNDLEELQHDRRDAAEVSRPVAPAQMIAELCDV